MNDETLTVIAQIMEDEKNNLFRYALYRLGSIDDAEDILQELFMSLSSTADIIEKSDNLKSYIFRSLSNNICTHLRKRQKLQFVPLEAVDVSLIVDTEPQNFEQEYAIMEKLLNSIPAEQSEVIRLHIHGNCTFVEIAAIMELPLTTIKSRYKYGIDKLRKGLFSNYPDY